MVDKSQIVILLFVCALAIGEIECDSRIVGGVDATLGQVPYQVSLRAAGGGHFCGGSIIEAKWILTAAHCVKAYYPAYSVAGTLTLTGGTIYYTALVIPHENYSGTTYENDIALIKTNATIEYTAYVKAIPLGTAPLGANVNVLASGWGYTSYPGSVSPTLKVLQTRSITNADCQARWGSWQIFDSVMCVFTQAGQGTCSGDSGGPHVANGELHGISSWASLCARGYPDGTTKVASFIPWIYANKIANWF